MGWLMLECAGILLIVWGLCFLVFLAKPGSTWNDGVHGKRHPEDLPAIRYRGPK